MLLSNLFNKKNKGSKPVLTSKPMTFRMCHPDATLATFLSRLGHKEAAEKMKADFLVFSGGPDICPLLYGEKTIKETKFDLHRDRSDLQWYRAVGVMTPKLGICRGAQFLNVMSGGGLIQDVDNHKSAHDVLLNDRKTKLARVTSTHHQMMESGHEAYELAYANRSTVRKSDSFVENKNYNQVGSYDDLEAVFYWNTTSLCIQWHPEYSTEKDVKDKAPDIVTVSSWIDEYLTTTKKN